MAFMIPSINSSLGAMTAGEKRFAERLEQKLENESICWFNIPIDGKYPDFVILDPNRGILVLEVKDWHLNNIHEITKLQVRLHSEPDKILKNPLEQARDYQRLIVKKLGNVFLKHHNIPYAVGVVLTNITRKSFSLSGLDSVLPEGYVICSDEMYESIDNELFQNQLWSMLPFIIKKPLEDPEVQHIRATIYPEISIQPKQEDLFGDIEDENTADQRNIFILRHAMDLQQEQLARSLGTGHRVIHGVAGSGKTLILKFRAEFLANYLKKPILVVCYNKELANDLKRYFDSKEVSEQIDVFGFHKWCRYQLARNGCKLPSNKNDSGQYSKELVEYLEQALECGTIDSEQYGAILIDEGHDFEEQWFKILIKMLDSTEMLLVLYDDAQSIYDVDKKKIKSFSSVGINARGRTTILRINYRNPYEIIQFAKKIAISTSLNEDKNEDSIPVIIPESAGHYGEKPCLINIKNHNYKEEAEHIISAIIDEHKSGRPWKEIAIIHRYNFFSDEIKKYCHYKSIPIMNQEKTTDGIHFITMHSSKGLEFPYVCIPSAGRPHKHNGALEDETKLLYVAMTRSTEKLLITYHDDSIFYESFSRLTL